MAAPVKADPRLTKLLTIEELSRQEAKKAAARALAESSGWADDIDVWNMPPSPKPDTLTAIGRGCTVVSGSLVLMYGSRSSGKTWAAAAWAAQELRAGAHVLWIDFENQGRLTGEKFRAMLPAGVSPNLHYRVVKGTPDTEKLAAEVAGYRSALVVIDAMRGLQGAVAPGTNASDGDAVEMVNSGLLGPLCAAGATVCVIDHRPKAGDSAFGSERKESMADMVLKAEKSGQFARDKSGFTTLTVTKDRYGWNVEDTPAGYLWVPSASDPVDGYPDVPEIRAWAPVAEGNLAGFNGQRASGKETRVLTVIEMIHGHPDQFRSRREFTAWATTNAPDVFATQWEAEQAFKYACDGKKIAKYANGYRVADDAAGGRGIVRQLNGDD